MTGPSSATKRIFTILAVSHSITAFQLHPPASLCSKQLHRYPASSLLVLHNENPKLPEEQEDLIGAPYESSIDWDAEWKKVVDNKDQPAKRPNPITDRSILEIRAKIAQNKVAKNVYDAKRELERNVSRDFNWSSLQGDWKVSQMLLFQYL